MKRPFGALSLCGALALAPLAPARSYAQPRPDAAGRQEAAARYNKGVELFKEGDHQAALIEFRRAYEMSPDYRVLYNIGQVYYQLQDYASALDALERYLREGGDNLSADKRAQVTADIDRLRPRIARVEFGVNVAGAEITIDDVPVGTSPLAKPLAVSAGRRKITVSAEGRQAVTKIVDVAGNDTMRLTFNLPDKASARASEPQAPPQGQGRPGRSVPWVGWAVAGGLAAGAVVFGALALDASNDLDKKKDRQLSKDEYDDAKGKMVGLSIATDVLAGGALVAGVVSTVLTLKGGPADRPTAKAGGGLRAFVSPRGVGFGGTF